MDLRFTRYIRYLLLAFCIITLEANANDFATALNFPGGGVMNKLAVNPNTNAFFCAVWGEGLYRSTDKGLTWIKSDVGITTPYINDVIFDKNGEGYAATQGGGIFRTTNNGLLWSAASTGLSNKEITALGFGPGNIILAGSAGSGMYVSRDKGATWTNSRVGIQYQDIKTIATAHNGFILAGTYGGGIFLSRDSGLTWKANNSGLANKYINQIVVSGNSNMYVATNGDGVYFSGNNGTYWAAYDSASLRDKYVTCLCFNEQRELVAGTRSRGIYLKDDSMYFKWKMVSRWDEGVASLACNNSGIVLYTNMDNIAYYSDTKARSFQQDGGTIVPIPTTSAITLGRNGLIIAKNTSKPIQVSTDYGNTWTAHGRESTEVNSFAFDSSGRIFMGSTSGLEYSADMGANWTPIPLDITQVVDVEISPSQEVYISTIKITPGIPPAPPSSEMKILRSDDLNNWTTLKQSTSESYKKLAVTVSGDLIYQVGDTGLSLINNDGSGSWTSITGTVNDFEYVAPNDIYVAGGNKLYRSTNSGANWQNTRIGKPLGVVIGITTVGATPYGEVYAGFYYYDSLNRQRFDVRRSSDFINWDSLSTGLTMGEYTNIDGDREGNIYIMRNNLLRIINNNSFRAPGWVYPAPNAQGIDTNLAFKWRTSRLTELYEMELSQSPDFDIIDDWTFTSDTLYASAYQLSLGATYYARVRSRANDHFGPWSSMSFMTKLGGPILISPEKNSTGVYYSTDLLWEAVDGADYYRVEVSEKSDFSALAFSVDSTVNLTVKTSKLKPNTQYFWRVKARTKTNSSEWSEVWNFRTTLSVPELVSPANKSKDLDRTVLLKWKKVEGAPSYDVEVATSDDFAAPIATKSAVTDTSVTIEGLEYNTIYFWRVSAGAAPVVSDWSGAWSFTTGIEPPTLVSPADKAAGLPPNVTLTWEFAPAGSYTYEIQIDTSLAFSGAPRATAAKTYDTTGLRLSSKYFWRARAVKGSQKGFWSEAWSFT
ncbi:MAG: hypothetical protein ACM3U1_01695, partial [Chloroflexota bacterium]